MCMKDLVIIMPLCWEIAESAGIVECTNCISAEVARHPPNECPGYDIKQSDDEVPILELLEM